MRHGPFLSDETPAQRWDRENYWDRLEAARSGNALEGPKRAANRRAKEFFESSLTEEQLARFKAQQEFFLIGGVTGHIYKIRNHFSFNIVDVTDGVRYCGGPVDVPIYDRLASQKMWLDSDAELDFLKGCNKL